jgi:glutamate dehydrogenase (NADP+)
VQNASRDRWTFEHTDARLEGVLRVIDRRCHKTSVRYGDPDNLELGANIAGLLAVAEALHA